MPEPTRTVFATLLANHRRGLKLTQAALAARTAQLRDTGAITRAVTERTVAYLEHLSPNRPRVPHNATVRALALALELAPGTPEYDAFTAAALNPTATALTAPASPAEPDAEFIAAGRESQLARLTAFLDLAASGTPAVGLVTGPAGSGKSRLLEEACRRAIERHRDAVVLWSACPRNSGTMATHEPFRAMIGQMLRDPVASGSGPLPVDNERRLAGRLTVAARAVVGPAAALAGTLLPTGALANPVMLDELDPELRERVETLVAGAGARSTTPNDIDDALLHLLKAYASAGPVMLVIDDLHWADTATLRTIRRMVDELAASRLPVALLGSIRTVEWVDGPAAAQETLELQDHVARRFPTALVDLAPAIGGDTGRAFVDAAVTRLHLEPLAQRLYERTSGMPLFVMSFLRLHATNDSAIAGSEIPGAIGTVFARQLARLDDGTRALLAAASVQGDAFLAEPALAVAGIPPVEGTHRLDTELADQVRLLGEQPVAPETTMHRYRFAHAVLRDHVLGTLSALEQTHLHLATADALIRILGPRGHDAIEAIATQLERGGDLARAAAAWIDAGDRAMHRSDHLHAHDIYRHARNLGIEDISPHIHIQALVGIGNSFRGLGQPDAARRTLQQARREAIRRELHTIDANALVSLGVLDFDAGRMVAGAARFGDAIDAYTRAGNTVEASRATANLSMALHGMGRYDDARARAERAIEMAHEAGDVAVLASAEIALANCWLDLGHYERAIARYEAGLATNDANGLTHFATICLLNIALCHIELGRWDDAEATLDRLDDPGRKVVERMRSVIAFNGAMIAEGRGHLDIARRRYDASRLSRMRIGQEPLVIDSLAGLLRAAVAAREQAETERLVADITTRIDARGIVGVEHLGRLYLSLIEGSGALGDVETAARWLSEALSLLGERADLLANPVDRGSYLTRPPAHRRILALARTEGLPVPDSSP
jgi:predicted ATPase